MNLLQGFNVVDGNSLKEDFDALAIDAGALGAIKVLANTLPPSIKSRSWLRMPANLWNLSSRHSVHCMVS
jgi:hypothetical protein